MTTYKLCLGKNNQQKVPIDTNFFFYCLLPANSMNCFPTFRRFKINKIKNNTKTRTTTTP